MSASARVRVQGLLRYAWRSLSDSYAKVEDVLAGDVRKRSVTYVERLTYVRYSATLPIPHQWREKHQSRTIRRRMKTIVERYVAKTCSQKMMKLFLTLSHSSKKTENEKIRNENFTKISWRHHMYTVGYYGSEPNSYVRLLLTKTPKNTDRQWKKD